MRRASKACLPSKACGLTAVAPHTTVPWEYGLGVSFNSHSPEPLPGNPLRRAAHSEPWWVLHLQTLLACCILPPHLGMLLPKPLLKALLLPTTCGKSQGRATPLLLTGDKMYPAGRLPGSGQQAFFLGLSPPSSCPFSLSLFLVRKQRKTTLWGDWICAPERPKQKGRAGVPPG